ncbi:MAG: dienelactone hydrolase family protein [Polyangia bacterium]
MANQMQRASTALTQSKNDLSDFAESTFTHCGITHPVYRRGSGPGVVLMHELPGITPEVIRLARYVADAGFTVVMPCLFGTPGRDNSGLYLATELARICVRKEFSLLAKKQPGPIADWLRTLCRNVHAEIGGRGIGVIGMCLTGNFALSMMADPCVMAPVISQPSLPLPIGSERRCALQIPDDELVKIKQRASEGVPVLGLRFTADGGCPDERFARLRSELGERLETIEIDSSPGNRHGIPQSAHSVLTLDLVDQQGHPTRAALERVLSFLGKELQKDAPAAAPGPLVSVAPAPPLAIVRS